MFAVIVKRECLYKYIYSEFYWKVLENNVKEYIVSFIDPKRIDI